MKTSQTTFAGGEVSEDLYGRVDLAKYFSGLKVLKNMILHPQGGVSNAPGTKFLGEAPDQLSVVRLIPFIFSTSQAYCLVFTERRLAIIHGDGFVIDRGTGQPFTATTSYTADNLKNLRFNQSKDVLFLTLNKGNIHPVRALKRYAHDDWRFEEVTFEPTLARPAINSVVVDLGGTGKPWKYCVTAISLDSDESRPSDVAEVDGPLDSAADKQVTVTWLPVPGADRYLIYKATGDTFGYVGYTYGTTFVDTYIAPNTAATPPGRPGEPNGTNPLDAPFTFDANLTETNKGYSGCVASNGRIYGIPFNSTRVLEIDPVNHITTMFGDLHGGAKWAGGCVASNGRIYGIPYDSTQVLEIDPVNHTTTMFGDLQGSGKWYGGCVASNGRIYGIPYNSTQVLEIDPVNRTTTMFGNLQGSAKWRGGCVARNEQIFGIPHNSTQVLEINPVNHTTTLFGNLQGSAKWAGGCAASNGGIYGIPYDSTQVLEIDPFQRILTTFGSLQGSAKWTGGCVAGNGRIYGIPYNSTQVLEINPVNRTTTMFGDLQGSAKWNGGCVASNEQIYGIPYDSTQVLEINTEDKTTMLFGGAYISYPKLSFFYQQRLGFANTENLPLTLWFSKTSNFYNFDKSYPIKNTDSMQLTMDSSRVEEIRHVISLQDLIVLTSGAEWRLKIDGALSPTSPPIAQPQSHIGSNDTSPIIVSNNILHVSRSGTSLREMVYSLESGGYKSASLTVLVPHFFKSDPIKEIAFAQEPDSIIWVVTEKGRLYGLTYMKEQEVWGWHQHHTDGEIESICTLPQVGDTQVYMAVTRFVDGKKRRYIEKLAQRMKDNNLFEAFFVHSGFAFRNFKGAYTGTVTYNGATNPLNLTLDSNYISGTMRVNTIDYDIIGTYDDSGNISMYTIQDVTVGSVNVGPYKMTGSLSHTLVVTDGTIGLGPLDAHDASGTWAINAVDPDSIRVTTLTGLDHLEGKEVTIFSNGSVEPKQIVTGGQITLVRPSHWVTVGLPIECELRTLNIDTSGDSESLQGEKINVPNVVCYIKNTIALKIGTDDQHMREIKFRQTANGSEPIPLFTGKKVVSCGTGHNRRGEIVVKHNDPVPLTILSITPEIDIGE